MRRTLVFTAYALALCAFALMLTLYMSMRVVPTCEEDATLIGTGTFDHGRWSTYVCGQSQ